MSFQGSGPARDGSWGRGRGRGRGRGGRGLYSSVAPPPESFPHRPRFGQYYIGPGGPLHAANMPPQGGAPMDPYMGSMNPVEIPGPQHEINQNVASLKAEMAILLEEQNAVMKQHELSQKQSKVASLKAEMAKLLEEQNEMMKQSGFNAALPQVVKNTEALVSLDKELKRLLKGSHYTPPHEDVDVPEIARYKKSMAEKQRKFTEKSRTSAEGRHAKGKLAGQEQLAPEDTAGHWGPPPAEGYNPRQPHHLGADSHGQASVDSSYPSSHSRAGDRKSQAADDVDRKREKGHTKSSDKHRNSNSSDDRTGSRDDHSRADRKSSRDDRASPHDSHPHGDGASSRDGDGQMSARKKSDGVREADKLLSLDIDSLLQDERLRNVLFAGISKATAKLEQSLQTTDKKLENYASVDNSSSRLKHQQSAHTSSADAPQKLKSILKRKTEERVEVESKVISDHFNNLSNVEKSLYLLSEKGSQGSEKPVKSTALSHLQSYNDSGDEEHSQRDTNKQTKTKNAPFWSVDAIPAVEEKSKDNKLSDIQEQMYEQWRQSINQSSNVRQAAAKEQAVSKVSQVFQKPEQAHNLASSSQAKRVGAKDEDELDSTVENILQSIGFNFDLSKRMQELARERKKQEDLHTGMINQSASFLGQSEEIVQDVRAALFSDKPEKAQLDSLIQQARASMQIRSEQTLKSLKNPDYEELSSEEDDVSGIDSRKIKEKGKRQPYEKLAEVRQQSFSRERDVASPPHSKVLLAEAQRSRNEPQSSHEKSLQLSERLRVEKGNEYFYPDDSEPSKTTSLLEALSSKRREISNSGSKSLKLPIQSGLGSTRVENLRVTSRAVHDDEGDEHFNESRKVILSSKSDVKAVPQLPVLRKSQSPEIKVPRKRPASPIHFSMSKERRVVSEKGSYSDLHAFLKRSLEQNAPEICQALGLDADKTSIAKSVFSRLNVGGLAAVEKAKSPLMSDHLMRDNVRKSPNRQTSRSPDRQTLRLPGQQLSGSPERRKPVLPDRRMSRSPDKRKSPDRKKSPNKQISRSPDRRKSLSLDRQKLRPADRRMSKSPDRRKSRSPDRRKSRSPDRRKSRSPDRRKSRSPDRRKSRSPDRRKSRSPDRRKSRSPDRRKSRTPDRRKSRTPDNRKSRTPDNRKSRTPDRRKSRTPDRQKSRSPGRRMSRSPGKWKSTSPSRRRSRSPDRRRSRSLDRCRSRSLSKRTSKSPVRRRIGSPDRRRSRSPDRRRSRSPQRLRSRSPDKHRSVSPFRRRSLSLERRRSRSPSRRRSRSLERGKSRSPARLKARLPLRARTRSPAWRRSKSPLRRLSRSPGRRTSKSPLKRLSRSPGRRRSKSPLKRLSRSPGKRMLRSQSTRRSRSPRRLPPRARSPLRLKKLPERQPLAARERCPYPLNVSSAYGRQQPLVSIDTRKDSKITVQAKTSLSDMSAGDRTVVLHKHLPATQNKELPKEQVEGLLKDQVNELQKQDKEAKSEQEQLDEDQSKITLKNDIKLAVEKLAEFPVDERKIILIKMTQMGAVERRNLLDIISEKQIKVALLREDMAKLVKEQNEMMRQSGVVNTNIPKLSQNKKALASLIEEVRSLLKASLYIPELEKVDVPERKQFKKPAAKKKKHQVTETCKESAQSEKVIGKLAGQQQMMPAVGVPSANLKSGIFLIPTADSTREPVGGSRHADKSKDGSRAHLPTSQEKVYYEYYDSSNYSCKHCLCNFSSLEQSLRHKHTKAHLTMIETQKKPWKTSEEKQMKRKEGLSRSREIKGEDMIFPVLGFYCSVCREFFGDTEDVTEHLKNDRHYDQYMEFAKNRQYEKSVPLAKTGAHLKNETLDQWTYPEPVEQGIQDSDYKTGSDQQPQVTFSMNNLIVLVGSDSKNDTKVNKVVDTSLENKVPMKEELFKVPNPVARLNSWTPLAAKLPQPEVKTKQLKEEANQPLGQLLTIEKDNSQLEKVPLPDLMIPEDDFLDIPMPEELSPHIPMPEELSPLLDIPMPEESSPLLDIPMPEESSPPPDYPDASEETSELQQVNEEEKKNIDDEKRLMGTDVDTGDKNPKSAALVTTNPVVSKKIHFTGQAVNGQKVIRPTDQADESQRGKSAAASVAESKKAVKRKKDAASIIIIEDSTDDEDVLTGDKPMPAKRAKLATAASHSKTKTSSQAKNVSTSTAAQVSTPGAAKASTATSVKVSTPTPTKVSTSAAKVSTSAAGTQSKAKVTTTKVITPTATKVTTTTTKITTPAATKVTTSAASKVSMPAAAKVSTPTATKTSMSTVAKDSTPAAKKVTTPSTAKLSTPTAVSKNKTTVTTPTTTKVTTPATAKITTLAASKVSTLIAAKVSTSTATIHSTVEKGSAPTTKKVTTPSTAKVSTPTAVSKDKPKVSTLTAANKEKVKVSQPTVASKDKAQVSTPTAASKEKAKASIATAASKDIAKVSTPVSKDKAKVSTPTAASKGKVKVSIPTAAKTSTSTAATNKKAEVSSTVGNLGEEQCPTAGSHEEISGRIEASTASPTVSSIEKAVFADPVAGSQKVADVVRSVAGSQKVTERKELNTPADSLRKEDMSTSAVSDSQQQKLSITQAGTDNKKDKSSDDNDVDEPSHGDNGVKQNRQDVPDENVQTKKSVKSTVSKTSKKQTPLEDTGGGDFKLASASIEKYSLEQGDGKIVVEEVSSDSHDEPESTVSSRDCVRGRKPKSGPGRKLAAMSEVRVVIELLKGIPETVRIGGKADSQKLSSTSEVGLASSVLGKSARKIRGAASKKAESSGRVRKHGKKKDVAEKEDSESEQEHSESAKAHVSMEGLFGGSGLIRLPILKLQKLQDSELGAHIRPVSQATEQSSLCQPQPPALKHEESSSDSDTTITDETEDCPVLSQPAASGDVSEAQECTPNDNVHESSEGKESTPNVHEASEGKQSTSNDNVQESLEGKQSTPNVQESSEGKQSTPNDIVQETSEGKLSTPNVQESSEGKESTPNDNVQESSEGKESTPNDNVQESSEGKESTPNDNVQESLEGKLSTPNDNVHESSEGKESTPNDNVQESSEGKESTPDVHESSEGKESTPNVHESSEGKESTPKVHESSVGKESTPDVHESSEGKESTPNVHESSEGKESTPDVHESSEGKESTPNDNVQESSKAKDPPLLAVAGDGEVTDAKMAADSEKEGLSEPSYATAKSCLKVLASLFVGRTAKSCSKVLASLFLGRTAKSCLKVLASLFLGRTTKRCLKVLASLFLGRTAKSCSKVGLQLNLDSERVLLAASQRGRLQSSVSLWLRALQTAMKSVHHDRCLRWDMNVPS